MVHHEIFISVLIDSSIIIIKTYNIKNFVDVCIKITKTNKKVNFCRVSSCIIIIIFFEVYYSLM